VTQTLPVTTALSASDRCDRCGAQAYVRVVLASGQDLLFCGHHAREHEDRLRAIAADYDDQSGRLAEQAPAR
jgi:hypothetical protein